MQESHRIEYLKLFVANEVVEALQALPPLRISLPMIRVLSVHNETTKSFPFPFDSSHSALLHTLHIWDLTLRNVSRAFHPAIRKLVLVLTDEDDMEGDAGEDEGELM